MLSDAIVSMLNRQMNEEVYSSNLYLQMTAWSEGHGLAAASKFFRAHVPEELDHRDRIATYLFECDAPVSVGAVAAPPQDWPDLLVVLQQAYAHEQKVTASINAIASTALDERDFNTFNFLQWFIAEQREEEALFRDILDHARLIGFSGELGAAMWHLNSYLYRVGG